ncbi:MAG TPA: GDSL-type esterase/lipase family protein [Pseudonocardiaceae bacterium]|nr:GDSL-type esterase/lipase family protein [Pseudonocardiaceae bacterium]
MKTRWGRKPVIWISIGALTAALGIAASSPVFAAPGKGNSGWFTSWAQSQQGLATTPLNDQTVRMITHLSQGGDAVRIRIQNQFGTAPLRVDAAAVALSLAQTPANEPGTSRNVTFNGHRSVTVPVGGQVWSDSVKLATKPQDDVAVSMFVPDTEQAGVHNSALRDNWITAPGAGNHVGDVTGTAFTQTVTQEYLVSAVDVHNTKLIGTIVPYGSSIVDGTGSTNCGPGCTITGNYQRWADDLARRIVTELPANEQLAVANEGIGGTTSAVGCPNEPANVKGLEAGPRLTRDVLALHGVTGVIFYYGTNDLQDNCTSEQILDSYRPVFQRLHAAGLKVYVVATTPRPIYDDQMNQFRWDVDNFTMNQNDCSGLCDGVIDFSQVIEQPLNPNAINLDYDNGDGIHVNIAGQAAEAATLNLKMLVSSANGN